MNEHEHKTLIKQRHIQRAHNKLCDRSNIYHNWHHTKHHQKVHTLILSIYIGLILAVITQTILPQGFKVQAASNTWNLTTPTDYTYDDTKIEFNTGVAQLKPAGTPGTDWIATDGGGNNWGYRKKIVFDNSAQAENLIDFPVLVKLEKDTDIDYAKTQSSGQDIRFTDSNGSSALKHEIEKWDETGTSYVWVKVPQIDLSSNTDYIYMYYGNSTVADGQDGVNVWDDSFLGVWHSREISGVTLQDSTNNDKDATKTSATQPNPTATGQIDGAQTYAGADRAGTTINNALTDFTLEVWFKDDGVVSAYERLADKSYTGCFWFGRNGSNANSWGGGIRETSDPYGRFVTLTDGQWHQISSVRSGSTHYVYGDGGTVSSSNTPGNTACDNTNFAIGAYGDNSAQQRFGGAIDEVRLSSSARSLPWLAASYKSGQDTFNTIEAEVTLYPITSPTLIPTTGQGYSSVSGFSETLGAGSVGTIKYQISPDNGSTWYWYTGGAWTVTSAGYTEANTSSDINTNLSTFTAGTNPKTFKWKAYFNSDGSQLPKLDSIDLTYVWDTGAPNTPTLNLHKSQQSGGVDITDNTWYNYPTPYFSWNVPSDTANEGETQSGIAGYYVVLDERTANDSPDDVDPYTVGNPALNYQAETTFTTSGLTSGKVYDLRIRAKDAAGNRSAITTLFTYKYDGTLPSNPTVFSISPIGWHREKTDLTFSWYTTGGNRATDTGGSALLGYQYRINGGTWYGANHTGAQDITDVIAYGTGTYTLLEANDFDSIIIGENTFELRSLDNAGNTANTTDPNRTLKALFYFNSSAPTSVTGLEVNPSSGSTTFAFSWTAPEPPIEYTGDPAAYIDHYRYYVNDDSDPAQIHTTTSNSITGVQARINGTNTFYIQAVDNAGNIGDQNQISFILNATPPDAPTNLTAVDGSNRDTQEYKVFLTWSPPAIKGALFNGYSIYRSTDGVTFGSPIASLDGTNASTTYADSNLESTLYYYYIKAKDNANQTSDATSTITITPTGRYTSAPLLTENPSATPKAFSVTVTWETDRESSSFIYLGKSEAEMSSSTGIGQPEKSTKHTVEIKGLDPSTVYYYQAMWEDTDGNQGRSTTYSFTTKERPRVTNVKFFNIGLTYATISFETTSASSINVLYGKSASYGQQVGGGTGSQTTLHSFTLNDLEDTSTYHFTIQGDDIDGNELTSDDYTFSTLERPRISSLRFESVLDAPTTSVKLTWTTNVETTSIVTYSGGSTGSLSASNADYALTHDITIKDLIDQSVYSFVAKGVDRYGNEAVGETNTFTTPDDTRPPKLSNLTVEIRTSGIGTSQKAQAVVSWETDEPGNSVIEYGPGISSNDYPSKTGGDTTYGNTHIVIINELEPSKLYHLRAVSTDKAGNIGYSEDTTAITGKVQKSAFDLILNSLLSSFSWLGKLFN